MSDTLRDFHRDHPLPKRKEECARIRAKYPDRVPIIATRDPKSRIPTIDTRKYLCPDELTVGQFNYVLRKRMCLDGAVTMVLFTGQGTLPPSSMLLRDLPRDRDDGFVYIVYASERAFRAFG